MTPYLQLVGHDPDNFSVGDCWRTCIGCLLNMPPEKVPHFCENSWDDGAKVEKLTKEWLRLKGLSYIEIPFTCTVPELLAHCAANYPDVYHIISGRVDDGPNHAMIGLNGHFLWDPSGGEDGILNGPMDTQQLTVTFLIPTIILAGA